MENKCRADGLVPVRLLIFPTHVCKGLRLPWKSAARSYEVLHLSRKSILDHLSKPQDRILETATFFRKSVPWPPNIIAPAIQESHACRCFFQNAIKRSSTFCSLLARCRIPCACHTKRHMNVQNRPKVLRTPQFFALLTSKCASRHYGLHFLNRYAPHIWPYPDFLAYDLTSVLR